MAWGCSSCRGPEFEEQDGESENRNCFNCKPEAGKRLSFPWAPGLEECPWGAIDQRAWGLFDLWVKWKTFRVLPFGARRLGELPAWAAQAIMVADTEFRSYRNEVLDREMEKHRKGAAKTGSALKPSRGK